MSIETLTREFVAATKKRAQARSHLAALRRKWQDDGGEYFDKDESRGEEGYDEMMAALKAREDCNAEYRRAKSRLFRGCNAGVAVGEAPSREKLIEAAITKATGEHRVLNAYDYEDVFACCEAVLDAAGVPGTPESKEDDRG